MIRLSVPVPAQAPAKINWFLHVLGRRPDGYHTIQSLMQKISLADTLIFEPADTIEIVTEATIDQADNLVMKAALALAGLTRTRLGARITLEKNIPLASGMGGGSSDAATALIGLRSLWGLDVSDDKLRSIATGIGSDVPFFLGLASSLAEGRGEILTPVRVRRSHALLLLKPAIGVSAAFAYRNLTACTQATEDADALAHARAHSRAFAQALDEGDYASLRKMAKNDLETPVLTAHPEIAALKKHLLQNGAELALMSGSGSTVFGLFRTASDAMQAEVSTETLHGAIWSRVVSTIVD